jgi:DNA-binding beta-propeller fold protein YncE
MKRWLAVLALGAAWAQDPPEGQMLATGWRIKPAGTQVAVGSLPMSSAVSPDGRFLLVLNGGEPASISVIRVADLAETSRVPLPAAWKGLTFSTDGRHVYAGGGRRYSVYELAFSAEGALELTQEMRAAPSPGAGDFIGDVAIPPAGRLIYAADLLHDQILVFNPQSGLVIDRFRTGRRPFQILFHPDGKSYWVSSWADGAVYQHETGTGADFGRIRVGLHPTGMTLSSRRPPEDTSNIRYRLIVAAQNSSDVYIVGVDGSKLMETLEVVNVGFAAGLPAGMTPLAVALNRDQTQLLVVCADVNAVAVADLSEDRPRLAGLLPVGAYPTGARVLSDGRVVVLNGMGGSISVIPALEEASLAAHTDTALGLIAYGGSPAAPSLPAALEHVVYIWPEADGGPNLEKLRSQFAAVPNYFPNSGGPVESLYWTLAGVAPPFTRLLSHALPPARLLTPDPANLPPAGYLWTNAAAARLTARNYGVLAAPPASAFLDDLAQFEASGQLPRVLILRAATDAELGRIVERLSGAPFWSGTAVFVGGARPVVVSAYSRGAKLPDTGFFNDSSLLRTMETILKLRPLTLFDAAARPLTEAFASAPDSAPFEAVP